MLAKCWIEIFISLWCFLCMNAVRKHDQRFQRWIIPLHQHSHATETRLKETKNWMKNWTGMYLGGQQIYTQGWGRLKWRCMCKRMGLSAALGFGGLKTETHWIGRITVQGKATDWSEEPWVGEDLIQWRGGGLNWGFSQVSHLLYLQVWHLASPSLKPCCSRNASGWQYNNNMTAPCPPPMAQTTHCSYNNITERVPTPKITGLTDGRKCSVEFHDLSDLI